MTWPRNLAISGPPAPRAAAALMEGIVRRAGLDPVAAHVCAGGDTCTPTSAAIDGRALVAPAARIVRLKMRSH